MSAADKKANQFNKEFGLTHQFNKIEKINKDYENKMRIKRNHDY